MVAAHFSEPIDQATLTSSSFRVIWAGTNGVIGDVDDMVVDGGVLTYRSDVNAAFLSFTTSLPPGNYEGVISPPLADLVGNPLARVFSWRFSIIGGKDSDQDGIPDDIEIALGLDPTNASTLNDGIVDGDRDLNGDGLPIRWELLYGYDPRSTAAIYTNPDGSTVTAANYDADFDGLTNLQEYQHGTNPLNADTDGDGWDDKSEIEGGTNPLDRNSQPQITLFVQSNVSFLNALPETPPTNAVWFAASSPVSFLNALEESPPAAALWSASSAVVSFMNALPENPPPETVWSLFSSILTYSNAPAPSSLSLRSKP